MRRYLKRNTVMSIIFTDRAAFLRTVGCRVLIANGFSLCYTEWVLCCAGGTETEEELC